MPELKVQLPYRTKPTPHLLRPERRGAHRLKVESLRPAAPGARLGAAKAAGNFAERRTSSKGAGVLGRWTAFGSPAGILAPIERGAE